MARRCSRCSAELEDSDRATASADGGSALCPECARLASREAAADESPDTTGREPPASPAKDTAEAPSASPAKDTADAEGSSRDKAPSREDALSSEDAPSPEDALSEDNIRTRRSLAKRDSSSRRPSVRDFGRYEIIEEINRGAMGIVYRARERKLGRVVALKVLLAGEHASEEQVGRFIREARAVARLRHPNIVPIHDVGEFEGLHYFTMDYIDGEPLSRLIARGEVEIREALDIIESVADAVECAHQAGVVHRDIKPSNIMIDSQGRPQITDFGLAKPVDSDTQYTRSGTTIGTPAYMPPEQARGNISAISPRSDVYSIGAVLYELVTGVAPFDGPNMLDIILDVIHDDPDRPRRMNPRVHGDVETIILRAMEKDPERRYASAADLRDDVRRFKAGEAIRARPPSVFRHVARWTSRHRVEIMAAVTVLAVLAGSAVIIRDYRRRAARDLAEAGPTGPARPDQPVWNTVWEDAAPAPGGTGGWEERASLLEGREISPRGREPFLGSVKMTATVEVAEGAKKPEVVLGLFSSQDDNGLVPFYGVVGGGKIALHGVADIERAAVARRTLRDMRALLEHDAPEPKPGARYEILLERRDLDLRFQIHGDGLDEVLVMRNLHLSNWRAKNLHPTLGLRPGVRWTAFRLDQLIAGEQDAYDAADMLFLIGEYNGAAIKFETIINAGRPPGRVDAARLRLGMCSEVKGRYDDAVRWYGPAESCADAAIALEASLREPFCHAELGRIDDAARALGDLSARAREAPEDVWDATRSMWAWELAGLAERFVTAKRFPAAAEVVALARPPQGWPRMESVAADTAKGLVEDGRAQDLFVLADACPAARLAPAFATGVVRMCAESAERALQFLAASVERYPREAAALAQAGATVARTFIAQKRFAQLVRVHRTLPIDAVFATFKDALAGAVAGKGYDQARALLAYAHSVKPKHDDVLTGLSVALAKQLCSEGRFEDVRWVYNSYPGPALIVSFREAAQGFLDAGDLNRTVSLLEFAQRNIGGGDGRLAAIAADVSRRFVEPGTPEQAARLFASVEAYPGKQHAPFVARAMQVLASGGRPQTAMRLFATLRGHVGEGLPELASLALAILEGVSGPEERENVFAPLDEVASMFEGNGKARATWLVELGDIACRVGGRPNRAEKYYVDAVGAGTREASGRTMASVASARRALLLETEGRRSEADVVWGDLASRKDMPEGLAEAVKLMAGRTTLEHFAAWVADHKSQMPEAEGAVYVGLRTVRDRRYEEAADAFVRALENTPGRRWPYHILKRLEDMLSRGHS